MEQGVPSMEGDAARLAAFTAAQEGGYGPSGSDGEPESDEDEQAAATAGIVDGLAGATTVPAGRRDREAASALDASEEERRRQASEDRASRERVRQRTRDRLAAQVKAPLVSTTTAAGNFFTEALQRLRSIPGEVESTVRPLADDVATTVQTGIRGMHTEAENFARDMTIAFNNTIDMVLPAGGCALPPAAADDGGAGPSHGRQRPSKRVDTGQDAASCAAAASADEAGPTTPQWLVKDGDFPERPRTGSGEDEDEASLCVICLDARKNVVFLPCGHVCCCRADARGLTLCPICRSAISSVVGPVFI